MNAPEQGPRLLVALPRFPTSLESGSARLIYHNLVELARRCDIHLLSQGDAPRGLDLRIYCRTAEFHPRPISRVPRPLRKWARRLGGIPRQVQAQRSAVLRRRIADLGARGEFDVLLLYELSAVQYCPPSCARRAIACIEDPQSLRLRRLSELPVWTARKRMRLLLAAWQMARYERRILPPLARVLLLSAADAEDMRRVGRHQNLGVASYATQSPPEASRGDLRTEGMIVYSGNMDHPANIDGALWLLDRVLPAVLERHSEATLWIVGARPDPRIPAAARRFGERVVITGRVDDVSRFVGRARVSVCPVRVPIGVQTKIVEALALGTPVVTTRAGNRGIGGTSGTHLQVEDDPGGFASRVAALLLLEDWERLSQEGRRLAAGRFAPSRAADELQRHIEEVRGSLTAAGL